MPNNSITATLPGNVVFNPVGVAPQHSASASTTATSAATKRVPTGEPSGLTALRNRQARSSSTDGTAPVLDRSPSAGNSGTSNWVTALKVAFVVTCVAVGGFLGSALGPLGTIGGMIIGGAVAGAILEPGIAGDLALSLMLMGH